MTSTLRICLLARLRRRRARGAGARAPAAAPTTPPPAGGATATHRRRRRHARRPGGAQLVVPRRRAGAADVGLGRAERRRRAGAAGRPRRRRHDVRADCRTAPRSRCRRRSRVPFDPSQLSRRRDADAVEDQRRAGRLGRGAGRRPSSGNTVQAQISSFSWTIVPVGLCLPTISVQPLAQSSGRAGDAPPSRSAPPGRPLSGIARLPMAAQRRRDRRRDRRRATPPARRRSRPTTARSTASTVTNRAGTVASGTPC